MKKYVAAGLLVAVAITSLMGAGPGPRRGKPASCPTTATVTTTLTVAEANWILQMRQEEKLARDVYLTLGKTWKVRVFSNIASAEQTHMNAVKQLITAYGLTDPVVDDTVGEFSDPTFAALYDTLVAQGSLSLTDAYEVGVTIEKADITDLNNALSQVQKANIRKVFQNLLNGSYNHLAAFESLLLVP